LGKFWLKFNEKMGNCATNDRLDFPALGERRCVVMSVQLSFDLSVEALTTLRCNPSGSVQQMWLAAAVNGVNLACFPKPKPLRVRDCPVARFSNPSNGSTFRHLKRCPNHSNRNSGVNERPVVSASLPSLLGKVGRILTMLQAESH
jgi:hypothetical protein